MEINALPLIKLVTPTLITKGSIILNSIISLKKPIYKPISSYIQRPTNIMNFELILKEYDTNILFFLFII